MIDLEGLDGYRKHQAMNACIRIYKKFSKSSACNLTKEIREAWECGKFIVDDLNEKEVSNEKRRD